MVSPLSVSISVSDFVSFPFCRVSIPPRSTGSRTCCHVSNQGGCGLCDDVDVVMVCDSVVVIVIAYGDTEREGEGERESVVKCYCESVDLCD